MAVELTRSPMSRGLLQQTQASNNRKVYTRTGKPNLRLVSNNQLQANATKAAFNASMERAQLSQKYWDEILEKLRKAGGGGGGGNDKRFDRIAVSMMLSNFLSNKTIQAMLRNFGVEIFGLNKISNQMNNAGQSISGNLVRMIGNIISNGITNMISLIVRRDAPTGRLYTVSSQLSALIGILSFQLNKLKEILEEDLKEFIKKLDVKEKIKRVKTFVLDFFIEMKDELLLALRSFTEKTFYPQLKPAPHELYRQKS